jgi:hypothetical protein
MASSDFFWLLKQQRDATNQFKQERSLRGAANEAKQDEAASGKATLSPAVVADSPPAADPAMGPTAGVDQSCAGW